MTVNDDENTRAIAHLDYEALTAEAAERTKHQVALVDRGLQALMLANGGALVTLFALLGSGAHVHVAGRLVWTAFGLFALGLALTMLANLAAFLSQGIYYTVSQFQAWDAQRAMHGLPPERTEQILAQHRRGQHAEFGGIAAAALALFAFIMGCGLALAGFLPG